MMEDKKITPSPNYGTKKRNDSRQQEGEERKSGYR